MVQQPQRRPEDERRERALAAAGLGEWEIDFERDLLILGTRAAELLALPPGEQPARGGAALAATADDPERLDEALATARRSGGRLDVAFRLRTDGERAGRRLVAAPAGSGRWIGLVRDVTREDREALEREVLIAEVDHRVKNVLATVQALALQTAKRTTSLDAFQQAFSGRLKAMASANELLTAARWRGADIAHLAAAELSGVAPGQTRADGPEVFLTPRAANAVSLALHELATNALKYGALSTEAGRVEVRWTPRPDGGFDLTWTESGGPPARPPQRRGFGSTLLEQVTGRELNGASEVQYNQGGVRARLTAGPQAVAANPDAAPVVAPSRLVETVSAPSGPAELGGARVLIVEDAVLLALELETGLAEAGAAVVGPAYELEEALALADQPIDAAVLDANLNGRSVTPLAELLAARGVPFVFATGYGDAGGAPTGFDAPIIRKPYDVTQVAAAVAGLLRAG